MTLASNSVQQTVYQHLQRIHTFIVTFGARGVHGPRVKAATALHGPGKDRLISLL
jgi:hypothetical protein